MANTYTQIYIQIIFAVQGWRNLIRTKNKEELHKYITGIIRNKKQKLIAINAMPDHVHIFVGIKPNIAISDHVRDIKNNSTSFINDKKWAGENSIGRKDSEHFHTDNHKLMQL